MPPPVKQDINYTKQVYQHRKHYVEVWSCFKGDDVVEAKRKTKMENVAI